MNQKIRNEKGFGENIRQLRKKSGLTQEQVVTRLQLSGIDISRSSYSQIECGTYNVRVKEIIELSKLFNADFNEFFKGL